MGQGLPLLQLLGMLLPIGLSKGLPAASDGRCRASLGQATLGRLDLGQALTIAVFLDCAKALQIFSTLRRCESKPGCHQCLALAHLRLGLTPACTGGQQ